MSDYLSEEEQLAQLKAAWQRYGVPLVLVGVLAAGGFIGWRWLESNTAAEIAAASERYDAFLAADAEAQDALLEALVQNYGDTGYAALALLAEASEAVAMDDLDSAADHLQRAVTASPDPVLKDLARVRLARVHQQQGDSDAALADLGAVRAAGYRPLALELKGDIHMTRGEREQAHKAYVAAAEALQEGIERPLLAMKVTDTADAMRPAGADADATGAGTAADSLPEPDADGADDEAPAPAAGPEPATDAVDPGGQDTTDAS